MVAVSWRNVIALVLAPVVAILIDVWLWQKVAGPHEILLLQSGRQQEMMPTFVRYGLLSGICMLLCGQAVFALIRFGMRDGLFRASVLCAVVMTAVTSMTWSPHGRVVLLLAPSLLTVFSLAERWRRAAFGVCVVVAGVDWMLGRWLLHLHLQTWPLAPVGLMLMLVPVVGGATSVWLHQRFLEEGESLMAD